MRGLLNSGIFRVLDVQWLGVAQGALLTAACGLWI